MRHAQQNIDKPRILQAATLFFRQPLEVFLPEWSMSVMAIFHRLRRRGFAKSFTLTTPA
jgi:hypothetical protein